MFLRPKATMIDFILHIDDHIAEMIRDYGVWTYGILFLIVFCETGLVVTPFLPGDSLLFAAGIFAHPEQGGFNLWLLMALLIVAAILGDTVNYHCGKWFGPRAFRKEDSKIFKRSHLDKTNAFFEKHGGKAIVLARFVPIVRTFAPFVAGMGAMNYGRFIYYNVTGAILWVCVCVLAGYFFGGLKFVRDNFSYAVLAIIMLSIVPIVVEWANHRKEKKATAPSGDSPA
ncbi:MAG TPA: DedA family protein [Fimbriimonadaceae bacterium]|nr:DedA family protein [Fimbriimonadaceae bacterium]